ncbi:hypothetical protein HUW46_09390 [Amycolatopsis sp. CA-230715]|nr:hypothetical protein HUW46_09390 [Amycolatopsis sp. CA-230715]
MTWNEQITNWRSPVTSPLGGVQVGSVYGLVGIRLASEVGVAPNERTTVVMTSATWKTFVRAMSKEKPCRTK